MARLIIALVVAAMVFAVSLPAQGPLWPSFVGLLVVAVFLRSMQRNGKLTTTSYLRLAVVVMFIAGLFVFSFDARARKYGDAVVYLLGIAAVAAASAPEDRLNSNVAFISVVTLLASAWVSNAVTQATHELRTVGQLTDLDNQCTLALGPALLTAAWIVTICTASLFRFVTERLSAGKDIVRVNASLIRLVVVGSAAIGIAVGVTQWRDWQVQTACF